jgi:hypothetical protein
MNSKENYWIYDHDYGYAYDEELDYAWYEEDTWDAWKFWIPLVVILIIFAAIWVENWYTRPPRIPTAPSVVYSQWITGEVTWYVDIVCNDEWTTDGECRVLEHYNGNGNNSFY